MQVSNVFEDSLVLHDASSTPMDMKVYDFAAVTFRNFLEWLLARRLSRRFDDSTTQTPNEEDLAARASLINLYIFAYVYDVPQLRRDALEAYMESCTVTKVVPKAKEIITAYGSLPCNSPMIGFIRDAYAFLWSGPTSADDEILLNEIPSEFFRGLAYATARVRLPQAHFFGVCNYHEHV
jgi:hypothetical protein